jgi:RNA polymerase sigma factor (sigma-70 family)
MIDTGWEVGAIGHNSVAEEDERRALAVAIAAETPTLLAAARLLLLNQADARDLVQSSIEIALRRSSTLRNPASLRPWLLVIQTREAFRFRRRMRRTLSLESVDPDSLSFSVPTAELLCVRQALAALPLRIRSAVVLRHMAGLSVIEVAEAMKVSENTVKSELKVGMARLREVLRDE